MTRYLTEITRVLRPRGISYATLFRYADETPGAAKRTDTTPLRFEHPYGDGCFIGNPASPTGEVTFTDEAMHRMMKASGLKLANSYFPTAWFGRTPTAEDVQAVAILTPAE